ncbi:hypothetical protein AQUCO_00100422v1 [Aquilegia coerulea]|uniref:Protein ABIL5 n=1 Tax=Aquilegia coerulea TaxID=218851 RepID=A0A2G5FA84_AQUCA|nr:hypothetical protein AQUCO_00100422v1 [Aquilegia coerulea]
MKEELKPSTSNNSEANSDFIPVLHGNTECEFDENARFDKSLLELKDLSSQLHYAAKYCETSFLKSQEKKMVMENTKEYICRALVTVVDHLGSVSANLEGQLLGKQQVFDSEHKMVCLQQRLLTCQEYAQKLTLCRLCRSDNFQRHHTRYISLRKLMIHLFPKQLRSIILMQRKKYHFSYTQMLRSHYSLSFQCPMLIVLKNLVLICLQLGLFLD